MVLLLAIAGAIGFAIYKDATRFESRYGKGPWSAPALVWGLVGFAFGLIGALVYFIATKTTKKDWRQNTVWSAQDNYFDTNRYAAPQQPYAPQPQPYAPQPNAAPAPPAQWGPPPAPAAPAPPPVQWSPPGAPPAPPGPPPAPNVGGSDFLPRR